MAKKNKKKDPEVIIADYAITEAQLKDDFCHYTYEILRGVGEGDEHKVKGKGIAENDLIDAFRKFNVHLACIDDVFKHSGVTIDNIDRMENHELTALYQVTGFKIKGSDDGESIILVGMKSISATGGRIGIETPKIPLDSLSSYKWYNELKEAADYARSEVDAYKNGKYIQPEPEQEQNPQQLTIASAIAGNNDPEEDLEEDLESARL